MYALDDKGERILDTGEPEAKASRKKRPAAADGTMPGRTAA